MAVVEFDVSLIEHMMRARAKGPIEGAMSYSNWKALGGCDLQGAELGGGFVWFDELGAEYVWEPKK